MTFRVKMLQTTLTHKRQFQKYFKRISFKSTPQTTRDSKSIGCQADILNLFAVLPNPQE